MTAQSTLLTNPARSVALTRLIRLPPRSVRKTRTGSTDAALDGPNEPVVNGSLFASVKTCRDLRPEDTKTALSFEN